MASIFISYRREDSAGYAGRVCDLLNLEFGDSEIFMDVEDIAPGQDFTKAIESRIAASGVVIAVIGTRWLEILRKRTDVEEDFVHRELTLALQSGTTLIPILVGGASMPAWRDLPTAIAELARRQALQLHDDRFDDDIRLLVKTIRCLPAWSADITGTWVADMWKEDQPGYRLRLELEADQNKLTGTAMLPSGETPIRDGILRDRKTSFSAVGATQAAVEPTMILFHGDMIDGELHLTSVDGNGVAKGVAHRLARGMGG